MSVFCHPNSNGACRKEAKCAMLTKHKLDFGYTNDSKRNWVKRQEVRAWQQASGGEKRTDGYEEEEEVVEEE